MGMMREGREEERGFRFETEGWVASLSEEERS